MEGAIAHLYGHLWNPEDTIEFLPQSFSTLFLEWGKPRAHWLASQQIPRVILFLSPSAGYRCINTMPGFLQQCWVELQVLCSWNLPQRFVCLFFLNQCVSVGVDIVNTLYHFPSVGGRESLGLESSWLAVASNLHSPIGPSVFLGTWLSPLYLYFLICKSGI